MEIEPTAIDLALQKFDTPVGPVYFVERHWNTRRCFSRDRALWHLAKIMVVKVFITSRWPLRHPDIPLGPGQVQRGDLTVEYHEAHERCIRRLRRILARKREIQKWHKKYDAWAAQRDELMKQRPY
ncbi:TPA: hypothetical protein ACIS09_001665 [Salmonella enterica subsp. enterica serovar Birkenhead]